MADINLETQEFIQNLSRLGAQFQGLTSTLSGFGTNVRSTGFNVNQSLQRLKSDLDRGRLSYRDAASEARRLERQFDNLQESTKQSIAGQRMAAIQQRISAQLLGEGVGQAVSDMGKLGIASAFDYFKNQLITAADSLQKNVGGTQMAFNLQNQALRDQAKILDGFGTAAAGAAAQLMLVPGGQTLAGIFAGGAVALKGFSWLISQTEEALKILQGEISKTNEAFKVMTNAGAIFTDGMTGVRNASAEVGLDLKDFSEMVGKNTDVLGKLGGSVSQGITRFTAVSREMRDFREGLLNLGYTVEDQAQLTIDYMAILQRSGQLEGKTAKDIAVATDAYLTNLRAITAFTGEDAKKAMQRSAQVSRQLAVEEKLSRMDEKAQARFRAGVETMPEFMQKGLMQTFLGAITDPDTAVALQQVPAYGELLNRTMADINNAALSEKEIGDNYQRNLKELGGTIQQQARSLGSSIGIAEGLGGSLTGLTRMLEEMREQGIKGANAQKENTTVTSETTKGLKNTLDPLTNEVNKAQVAFRDMSALITKDLNVALNKFAKEGLPGFLNLGKAVLGLTEQVQKGGQLIRDVVAAATKISDLRTPGALSGLQRRGPTELTPEQQRSRQLRQNIDRESPGAGTQGDEVRQMSPIGFDTTTRPQTQLASAQTAPVSMALLDLGDTANKKLTDSFVQAMASFQQTRTTVSNNQTTNSTDLATSVASVLQDAFGGQNGLNIALANLKTTIEADSQAQHAVLQQQIKKLDDLLLAMQDNNRYSERIANELA